MPAVLDESTFLPEDDELVRRYYLEQLGIPLWLERGQIIREHPLSLKDIEVISAKAIERVPAKDIKSNNFLETITAVKIEDKQSKLAHTKDNITPPTVSISSSLSVDDQTTKLKFSKLEHTKPKKLTQIIEKTENSENNQKIEGVESSNNSLNLSANSEDLPHSKNIQSTTNTTQLSNDIATTSSINELNQQILQCTQCPERANEKEALIGHFLFQNKNNNVAKNVKTIFLLIESPSDVNAQYKCFLSDIYLSMAEEILSSLGLGTNRIYISSLLKCHAPDQHSPDTIEINQCLEHLHKEFKIIQPNLIVTLGKINLAAIIDFYCDGNKEIEATQPQQFQTKKLVRNSPLSELRKSSQYININQHDIDIISTFHPDFLYRHPLFKKQAMEDWHRVRKKLSLITQNKNA